MPRIARMIVAGAPAIYHVISRTALDGYVIGEEEKDQLLEIIKRLSAVYFTDVFGFCLMGNHFHLLARIHPGDGYSDEEIKKRLNLYYNKDKKRISDKGQIAFLREKWASLPEYIREIKQDFSRFYNKLHNRKGFFWSERFKSVILDEGDTLIHCMAYVDLNPVRAGIVKHPEKYRWCSIGYHMQTRNRGRFLSLDLGSKAFGKNKKARLAYYRRFLNEKGSLNMKKKDKKNGLGIDPGDRFRNRNRYFSDSGIIGKKEFVEDLYKDFSHHFFSKHEKKPKTIRGMKGIYSLKRLSEKL